MIIEMKETDNIFYSPATWIVNAVNCDGIMGGGLARAFKELYGGTGYHEAYIEDCNMGRLVPGRVTLYKLTDEDRDLQTSSNDLHNVINFPTVGSLGEECRLEWIRDGLQELGIKAVRQEIKSIGIPALGCGIVGHDWGTVRKMIFDVLEDWSNKRGITIYLYPPK